MHDEIPWLDSSELIDEDSASSAPAQNQDSLAPIDLAAPDDDAELPRIPRRSTRKLLAALGAVGGSVAALVLLAGSAQVSVRTSAEHAASRSTPALPAQPVVAPRSVAAVALAPVAKPVPVRSAVVAPSAPRRLELRAAFASLNAGRPREALQRARAILNVAPERADAWLVLGSAYDALHDRPNALAAFRSCAARARGPALASCKQLAR